MQRLAVFFIRIYQIFLAPLAVNYKCRFNPTCSKYMVEAIEKKGLIKGIALGISRLLKCHPFSKKSGFDPVE